MHRSSRSLLIVALFFVIPPSAGANQAAPVGGQAPNESAPTMSAEEQAMMAAWQKAMTPGPQHEFLKGMAGTWYFTGKFWGAAGTPPAEATGRVERSLIHGGRVLIESVKSEMFGQPFEGHGWTGFDNVAQKYWSTWTDNMSTGVMVGYGTCDQEGVCSFTNEHVDPMTGQKKMSRSILRHEGNREFYELYDAGPGGKEYKLAELVFVNAQTPDCCRMHCCCCPEGVRPKWCKCKS